MGTDGVERAIEALRMGEPVLLPTDGVYGLCASPTAQAAVTGLSTLKGRGQERPVAIIAASLEALGDWLPELDTFSLTIARALLPGPYTLVLRNPARRYPWLTGPRPDAIGVRVAELPACSARVLDAVGAVAATSANLTGEPPAATLEDVPFAIRSACAAELDAGPLRGNASTVIDFSAATPVVLRVGAGAVEEALQRVKEALAAHPEA